MGNHSIPLLALLLTVESWQVKEEPEFGGFPAAPKQPTSPTMEASPSGMKVASPAPTGDAAEGKKKRSHKRRKVEDIPAKLQVCATSLCSMRSPCTPHNCPPKT